MQVRSRGEIRIKSYKWRSASTRMATGGRGQGGGAVPGPGSAQPKRYNKRAMGEQKGLPHNQMLEVGLEPTTPRSTSQCRSLVRYPLRHTSWPSNSKNGSTNAQIREGIQTLFPRFGSVGCSGNFGLAHQVPAPPRHGVPGRWPRLGGCVGRWVHVVRREEPAQWKRFRR